jgi:hypothetical protein
MRIRQQIQKPGIISKNTRMQREMTKEKAWVSLMDRHSPSEARAGIQPNGEAGNALDSRFRGNDKRLQKPRSSPFHLIDPKAPPSIIIRLWYHRCQAGKAALS